MYRKTSQVVPFDSVRRPNPKTICIPVTSSVQQSLTHVQARTRSLSPSSKPISAEGNPHRSPVQSFQQTQSIPLQPRVQHSASQLSSGKVSRVSRDVAVRAESWDASSSAAPGRLTSHERATTDAVQLSSNTNNTSNNPMSQRLAVSSKQRPSQAAAIQQRSGGHSHTHRESETAVGKAISGIDPACHNTYTPDDLQNSWDTLVSTVTDLKRNSNNNKRGRPTSSASVAAARGGSSAGGGAASARGGVTARAVPTTASIVHKATTDAGSTVVKKPGNQPATGNKTGSIIGIGNATYHGAPPAKKQREVDWFYDADDSFQ